MMSQTSRNNALMARVATRLKTAGEVRFIKDRGSDDKNWGWGVPGPAERAINSDFGFDARKLPPLAKTLRSTLMSMGHALSAYDTFTRLKSSAISPDGNLGGKGYIQKITDMRRSYMNIVEALSSLSDTLYDEIHAPHWSPDQVTDQNRERQQVQEIMEDVEEIKADPEEWAEGEEADMDMEHDGGSEKRASHTNRGLGVLPPGDYWVLPIRHGRPDVASIAKGTAQAMAKAKDVSRIPSVEFVEVRDSLGNLVVTIRDGQISHTASGDTKLMERVVDRYQARRR